MWNKLISYASDFVSFLLYNLDEDSVGKINRIVLFGSAARRATDKKSDVDIFIDTIEEHRIDNEIKKIKNDFYKSVKFKKYWSLLGIKNDINCIVGKLDDWKNIRRSVVSDGVTLYGKFIDIPEHGKSMILFTWENIKPNSKRVLFNKRIFGYKHHGKRYPGMLEKYRGEKVGKGSILVPLEHGKNFLDILRQMKIKVRIREILSED